MVRRAGVPFLSSIIAPIAPPTDQHWGYLRVAAEVRRLINIRNGCMVRMARVKKLSTFIKGFLRKQPKFHLHFVT